MAAAAVDVSYISTSYSVPEATLTTLLDSPTVDLVNELLQSIDKKAHEYDELKAEKLRADVELENAVRSGEARSRALGENVDKGLQEINDLRIKLHQEGIVLEHLAIGYLMSDSDAPEDSRSKLESELEGLKSNTSTSSAEIQTLHDRIASLESSNRDTLSLLESKSTAHDRLAEELSTQHQKILGLRKEVAGLEEKNQNAENLSTSAKFREQALQQEVELLKKNNDWYEGELKTRSNEYARYRKEKGARISELQRANEDATSTIESLKRTETLLRNRIDELTQKAEDAFTKNQQLQDAAAQAQDSFKVEIDSSRRLADLQQQSADTARRRLQEVQRALDQTNESAADEIGRMQAEVETERTERAAAESRIAQLELQVEKAQLRLPNVRQDVSSPSTPMQTPNGSRRAGPGSEIFSPAGSRMKGGLSFTQLYAEHANVKAELEAEKRRNQNLSESIDDMIAELERKQPEIEELHLERDHMETELSEYTNLLEEATTERDSARKLARSWEGQVSGLRRESEILRQQLRDLSAQLKMLLVGIQAREEGLGAISPAEQLRLEQVVREELSAEVSDEATDSNRFISQHLTIFRNIKELQEQNQNLLKITRDLSERMEGEEAMEKRNQREQDHKQMETLHAQVVNQQDEIKSLLTQSQSYVRERDMFRRMLSHRGSVPPSVEQTGAPGEFGESSNGIFSASEPPRPSNEQSSRDVELATFQKLVKEMQSQFDAYRQESTVDHKSLKHQADALSKEKGDLQSELARATSQLTLAHERYEMLNANYNMLKSENFETQKRLQSLAENSAKQDLRTQQVAEELIEAKSLAESLRHENSNIKAERGLSKSIENRLTEENRSLLEDRIRLNRMVSDMQTLQNERELSDSDTRRRLQSRIDSLESDIKIAQRKYDDEVEENRKAVLRREYEQDQNRTRLDDLAKSLSNVKEELIAAKTTRDQLQARVDEMKIELRSAEERLETLHPPKNPVNDTDLSEQEQNGSTQQEGLTRDQELAVEVSELKRDLDLARQEIQNAKKDVEQYKAFSQSSEEELNSINESHDQYREDMDRTLATREDKIKELEQRINDLSSELSASNNELSELRNHQEERANQLEEQRTALENEITRLKDDNERHAETAKLSQQDLKMQADIAQQAQQSYEGELLKHAEAAKTVQKLRNDYNELKTEIAEARSEAETAKATMEQSESNWTEVRTRYEGELTDLRNRREEIQNQNKVLHEQLQNFSAQISSLHQKRADDASTSAELQASTGADSLQEVIAYLRREKEIVDVQYELSLQEGKRLKQQLDYAQIQLDEVRHKLSEERQRQTDTDQSTANHNKLIQTINELNLFRESSTTLRAEARQAQSKLAEKTEEVQKLTDQIQPLQARIHEIETQQEMKDGELKLLQEDRDRWRQRTQDIIQKYDRIDPAELEALNTKVTDLQREKDQITAEKQALQEQIDSIPDRIAKAEEESGKKWQETRQKLTEQFKGRSRDLSAKIKQAEHDAEAARQEKDMVMQELAAVKDELQTQKAAVVAAETSGKGVEAGADSMEMQSTQPLEPLEEGQLQDHQEDSQNQEGLVIELQQARADLFEKSEQLASAQSEIDSQQTRITELEAQVVDLEHQLASNHDSQRSTEESLSADLGRAKQELEVALRENETLRATAASASINTTTSENSTMPTGEGGASKSLPELVQEQVDAITVRLEAEKESKIKQEEQKFKDRADNLKKQLNTKLKEAKESIRQEQNEEHQANLEKLRVEKDAEIEQIKAQHEEERQRLRTESEAAIQEAKRLADQSGPTSTGTAENSSTPATRSKLADGWTEQETKDFISKNVTVKNMIGRNVVAKLNQEKEALTKKLQGEQDNVVQKKVAARAQQLQAEHESTIQNMLEETKKKIEAEKKLATDMESKRQAVKLGMQERKAALASLKLEVVEKAAGDTPERPVKEVWTIAKGVQLSKPQASAPNQQLAGSASEGTKPAASTAPDSIKEGSQATSSPSSATTKAVDDSPSQMPQPNAQPQLQNQQSGAPGGLPQKPQQGAGTGPNALRGIIGQGQTTGIPRGGGRGGRGGQGPGQTFPPNQQNPGPNNAGQGQPPRGGSNLPRGPNRGRGQGRGMQHHQQGAQADNQYGYSGNSPGGGRGMMNPEARQFNPGPTGQKRSWDDGSENANMGGNGNGSKRPRGGAGGY
ncbi:MAG: hypothetical protein Q9157_002720 [Trypethelium eluteriae]